jgi:two-component system chemotaxis response regulator CheB
MAGNIRVMVVDDSLVIRKIISDFINETHGMEVVATASDGLKALEAFQSIEPDMVTLDVQMPHMDGLATLEALLHIRPVPVIMVSALTRHGADITLEALDRGAMDYVAKPERGCDTQKALRDDLVKKIRSVAGIDVRRIVEIRRERKKRTAELRLRPTESKQPSSELAATSLADKCIALGISTGGPPALSCLFEQLQAPMPPIVVVQHMPANFTKPLAWRLNAISPLSIKEAEAGDILRPNHVYIAPGGRHLQLQRQGRSAKVVLRDDPPVSGHRPSVDVLMKTAASIYRDRLLGVIMTGMGHDGVAGCRAIRAEGGYVLGQDEVTSDVYGMNKAAYVEGHVDRQFSLQEAAQILSRQVRNLWQPTPVGS